MITIILRVNSINFHKNKAISILIVRMTCLVEIDNIIIDPPLLTKIILITYQEGLIVDNLLIRTDNRIIQIVEIIQITLIIVKANTMRTKLGITNLEIIVKETKAKEIYRTREIKATMGRSIIE